jgi:aminoglycoside phosphotransferase (APT) family kinase protein
MNAEGKYGEHDLRETLEGYLKVRFAEREELVLSKAEKLRLSASHSIFMVRADWKEANGTVSEDLIIRMEPDMGVHQSYDIGRECETVKKMYGSGVPVPKIYWLEQDTSILGHPFVLMEKIEGERLMDAWMKHPEHRSQLMEDLISVLVKIHQVDWQVGGLGFLGEPEHDRFYALSEIKKWEQVLEKGAYCANPVAAELGVWLRRNMPAAERTTVCHGDYSVLNAYVHEGRIAAMLDWEMVGLGDPVSDIAWLCNMAAAVRMPDWDQERFIRGYEETSGTKVNQESLRFWSMFTLFKTIAIMMSGTRAFIESRDPNMREMLNFYLIAVATQDVVAKSLGF